MFATAVVALAGIAFSVLVGERGALRLEHGAADVVLGSDHLQMILLSDALACDGIGERRIR